MSDEQHLPDAPEPIDHVSPPPHEPSIGGAKLFVIFFLTLVPLIGMTLVALVIYSLLVR